MYIIEGDLTFLQLVERCVKQLEGAFAIVVKVINPIQHTLSNSDCTSYCI